MNRRSFLRNTTGAALLLKVAPTSLFAQQEKAASLSGDDYRKLLVIDALAGVNAEDVPLTPEVTRQALDSGITAVNWTVSMPDFESTVQRIAFVEALVEGDPAHWLIVRRHSDLDRAKREQKIGIMMGFQFPQSLEADLDRFELFRRLGVRIMQLTYNNRGLFGDGCLEPGNAGLSKLGKTAITRMNTLGIAVDLSHSGQRTTAEGIETSTKPVLITHAGCSAVHSHPRNKDDRELRALAERGGVIGIYFMPYLVASPTVATREHVLAHLDHALKVCGSDHVGVGSDGILELVQDTPEQRKAFEEDMANRKKLGIAAPEEDRMPFCPDLNTSNRMQILAEGLTKKGYSGDVIEKVLGRNFHRAIGEIWGTA